METGRRPRGQRPVGDMIPAATAAGLAAEPASASHSPAAATRHPWRAELQGYRNYLPKSKVSASTPFATLTSYVPALPTA